jgi:hypothetical protein
MARSVGRVMPAISERPVHFRFVLLKKRWRAGTTAAVMTKEVLVERLCALVPEPRKHLVTYHGVLAPASGLRSR